LCGSLRGWRAFCQALALGGGWLISSRRAVSWLEAGDELLVEREVREGIGDGGDGYAGCRRAGTRSVEKSGGRGGLAQESHGIGRIVERLEGGRLVAAQVEDIRDPGDR